MSRIKNAFGEFGRTGLFQYSGIIYEEFLRSLQGRKGVEVYKEMSENDSMIGAILFSIETFMRQVDWRVDAAGNSEADERAQEFVTSCMHDMVHTWSDFISEVLSFITFGWSWHEIVYKRRSKDGLIGWKKLPIRSQDTLWRWEYDANGDVLGLIQMAPPTFEQTSIPIEKSLHFKTRSRKDNPEGRSALRNAYRDWYFKRRIQEIEGIGIERDLAGLPVLSAPDTIDIWNPDIPGMAAQRAEAERIVQSIRRDSMEGVLLPPGWKLELLSSGGSRQFNTSEVIERLDRRMAMTMVADFLLLGHEKVGSYALSSEKTGLFAIAMGAYLDLICEVFNGQAIKRLIDINGDAFRGITDYPKLNHSDIEKPDIVKLSAFVKDMVGVGAITPDEKLEAHLRMVASLPEVDEASSYMSEDFDNGE